MIAVAAIPHIVPEAVATIALAIRREDTTAKKQIQSVMVASTNLVIAFSIFGSQRASAGDDSPITAGKRPVGTSGSLEADKG